MPSAEILLEVPIPGVCGARPEMIGDTALAGCIKAALATFGESVMIGIAAFCAIFTPSVVSHYQCNSCQQGHQPENPHGSSPPLVFCSCHNQMQYANFIATSGSILFTIFDRVNQ
jgi:hypothetical protein